MFIPYYFNYGLWNWRLDVYHILTCLVCFIWTFHFKYITSILNFVLNTILAIGSTISITNHLDKLASNEGDFGSLERCFGFSCCSQTSCLYSWLVQRTLDALVAEMQLQLVVVTDRPLRTVLCTVVSSNSITATVIRHTTTWSCFLLYMRNVLCTAPPCFPLHPSPTHLMTITAGRSALCRLNLDVPWRQFLLFLLLHFINMLIEGEGPLRYCISSKSFFLSLHLR